MPYQMDETLRDMGNCLNCGAFVSFQDEVISLKSETKFFRPETPLDVVLS